MALCRGCHTYFTHHPLEWEEWVDCYMGTEAHKAIKALAMTYQTPDWHALLAAMKANGLAGAAVWLAENLQQPEPA